MPIVEPLHGLSFSLVGAGRVGESLARWLVAAGARPVAIGVRRAGAPGEALAADLGARAMPVERLASAGNDLLLIAVADPALDEVAHVLAARPQATVALHTAGSRAASALAPLRRLSSATGEPPNATAIGSFHPLRAFPRPIPDPTAARGVLFALDGDPPAQELGRRLAAAWGAEVAVVPAESRDLYHFAAALAAGGVTTLVAAAQRLASRLGLPPQVGRGYLELARGALAAAAPEGEGAAAAITGPAARGDRATVLRQLDALGAVAPEMAALAALVARESLRLVPTSTDLDGPRKDLAAALEARLAALLAAAGIP